MATPDRRQSGWWGSISSGLFSSAAKRRSEPQPQPERPAAPPSRVPAIENGSHRDTPRPRVTFQHERSPSPESPVKRASADQLSRRKIIDRPQGPSSKLSTSTVRTTNFSAAAATPRPMFRASFAADGNRFSFTPRGGMPKPFKDSIRPASSTPSRDFRASTAESIGRGMARVPASELFPMKIPEPPANLTGEELAKRVPPNPNRVGSIYADEYLADLCPPEFNEAQRKQFFCILDLRRLKYAADEIFVKKDWRFNILNFAKEYEKSRSLIMLRYGLYEFKSIRPSQEVVSKWKADHGIPDEEDKSADAPANEARLNGTEGILSRGTGKRKAADEPPKATAFASSQPKRARGVEREPLTETATPALNKGNKRRMADDDDDSAGNPPSKLQRAAAPSPAKTPSATKKFFEQVANSRPSDSAASNSVQILVEPPSTTKPKANAFSTFGATTNGSATRSIFENASKPATGKLSANSNIFGHLSDTGSTQASGAENDAEDEDESGDESEAQEVSQSDEPSTAASGGVATPQPAGGLFGAKKAGAAAVFPSSTASSDAGDASGAGPSLFDRITRGDDGKPKRLLSATESPSLGPVASGTERAVSPAKEQGLFGGDKTWTAGTPIKFGTTQSASALPSTTPAPHESAAPAPKPFSFGANTASGDTASSAPKFGQAPPPASGSTPSIFGASSIGSSGSLFGLDKKETKPAAESTATAPSGQEKKEDVAEKTQPTVQFGGASSAFSSFKPSGAGAEAEKSVSTAKSTTTPAEQTPATARPLFGSAPGDASKPTFGLNSASQAKSVFDSTSKPLFGADPNADPSQAKPTFGLAPKTETSQPSSLFGAAAGSGASEAKPLFGSATGQDSSKPAPNLGATKEPSKPLFMFGSSTQPSESKTPFGSAPNPAAPNSLFGASTPGAASDNANSAPAPKPLFGSGSPALFGSSAPTAPGSKDTSATTKPLFGAATTSIAPQTTPTFSFGSSSATTTEPPKQQSTLFGSSAATSSPAHFTFGATQNGNAGTTTSLFGGGASQNGSSATPFSFNAGQTNTSTAPQSGSSIFGSGAVSAPSSFTFGAGGGGDKPFNNPFAGGGNGGASLSFDFGGPSQSSGGASSGGMFNFGGGSTGASNGTSSPVFNFGGASQVNGAADQGNAAGSIFNLAPPMGGASTGTNTPFTLGGASSLATTPAQGTPEPGAADRSEQEGQKADEGDEEKQAQINLTEGGPGEEDEDVVFEVRAKALKLCTDAGSEDDSGAKKKDKSPWKTMGVGPIRLLKHKETGAIRILLRAEPRGNIVMNKALLPGFTYKTEKGDKYVKVPTAADSGGGLETWMLQVKDAAKGKSLAAALEEHKNSGKKE